MDSGIRFILVLIGTLLLIAIIWDVLKKRQLAVTNKDGNQEKNSPTIGEQQSIDESYKVEKPTISLGTTNASPNSTRKNIGFSKHSNLNNSVSVEAAESGHNVEHEPGNKFSTNIDKNKINISPELISETISTESLSNQDYNEKELSSKQSEKSDINTTNNTSINQFAAKDSVIGKTQLSQSSIELDNKNSIYKEEQISIDVAKTYATSSAKDSTSEISSKSEINSNLAQDANNSTNSINSQHNRLNSSYNLEASIADKATDKDDEPTLVASTNTVIQSVAVSIVAKNKLGFSGLTLFDALESINMHFGKMNIFHRNQYSDGSGEYLFSLASLVEPGYFSLTTIKRTDFPGVTLFFALDQVSDPEESLDIMLKSAKQLAYRLDGYLLDQNHKPLTINQMEDYKENLKSIFATANA